MDFKDYLANSNKNMREIIITYDLAISSLKLIAPQRNWKKSDPFIAKTTGEKLNELDSFVLAHSEYFGDVMFLEDIDNENCDSKSSISVSVYGINETEVTLSKLVITNQYQILEEFEFALFKQILENSVEDIETSEKFTLKDFKERGFEQLRSGMINRQLSLYERESVEKRMKRWSKTNVSNLHDATVSLFQAMSNRRNQLTHDLSPLPPSMAEAIAFYYYSKLIAKEIWHCMLGSDLDECKIENVETKKRIEHIVSEAKKIDIDWLSYV